MVSSAQYRPFEEDDFDAVAAIVCEAWHAECPSLSYARLEAQADLAFCLARSTFSQVAVVNNKVVGVVLARAGQPRETDRLAWLSRQASALALMVEKDPGAVQEFYRYAQGEGRINAELVAQSQLPDTYEVVLLAVAERSRGTGAGSLLLDAAASYLRSEGAADAYLLTDTTCSWRFYEKRGLKRRAAYKTPRASRKVLASEYYLYGMELSD